jgi:predicted acyltransferase
MALNDIVAIPHAGETSGELYSGSPGALPAVTGLRLASIDALRGFDMFWLMQEDPGMLLALAAALHLPFQAVLRKQLDHTPWVGFTFWDLIAPLFLFIVGLALPFAIQSRLRRGESRKTILFHTLRRTALLIVLGLIYNGILGLNFPEFRYTGVLQRIALSYVFAAIITLMTGLRGRIAWTIALLAGYWAIMALIPVPGFGRNVLTMQGNLEGYIDRLFLPGKFCCYVYGDNEGYLSTIPSVATVMLGVLCTHILQAKRAFQGSSAGRGRNRQPCGWLGVGYGLPHHYSPLDKFLHALQQWLVYAAFRSVLLVD